MSDGISRFPGKVTRGPVGIDGVPDDVLAAAQDVAIDIECMPSDGNIRAIARAIMAERERCAKIAAGKSAEFDFAAALAECRDSEHGFHSGRLHAAQAIRGTA